jgi:hypothetical protein
MPSSDALQKTLGVSFATAILFTLPSAHVQILNLFPVVKLYVCEFQSAAPVATTSSLQLGKNYIKQ